MNKINIPFRGMTNVPDDSFSQDGSMSVLLDMRHKGGELVQCQPPKEENADKVIQVHYHPQSKHWLELTTNHVLQYRKDEGGSAFPVEGVNSFAVMGNIIIMYLESSVEYAMWREGGFVHLGPMPDIPLVGFSTAAKLLRLETSTMFRAEATLGIGKEDGDAAEKPDSIWFYAESGFAAGVLDKAYQKGMFIDRALFRIAFKLFDGSYINTSQVYMIENNKVFNANVSGSDDDGTGNWKIVGKDYQNLVSEVGGDGGGTNLHQILLNAFDVECTMGIIPEEWKDIIVSIDVFTSGSIMGKKLVEEFVEIEENDTEVTSKGSRKAERWVTKPGDELVEDIVNCNVYYKYASFDLNGKLLDKVDNTSPSMLAQGDSLTEWTRHELISEKTAVYNSRLHAIGNKRGLFPGYRDYRIPGDDRLSGVEILTVKVDIRTEEGIKEVVTTMYDVMLSDRGDGETIITFPGLLIYPDARAEKMTIYLQQEDNLRFKEFNLTKHDTLDLAYYIEKENRRDEYAVRWYRTTNAGVADIKDAQKLIRQLVEETGMPINTASEETYIFTVNEDVPSAIKAKLTYKKDGVWEEEKEVDWNGGSEFGVVLIPRRGIDGFYPANIRLSFEQISDSGMEVISEIRVDDSWIPEEAFTFPVEKTDTENVGTDVMKVSNVDNPFYFPTAQTYKFIGEIKCLANNAEAISTGQFGQYPLFVFTTEGIWAMAVDTSGQGAYVSQSPFSREVCNGGVCPVSGGVVFTTDRGVMAISGGQVTELSAPLDGLENLMFSETRLFDLVFNKAGKQLIYPAPIREYIQGAKLAYNYLHNEIILSNINKGYSYVYSLTNQEWSIIGTTFDVVTNRYPELVVYNNTLQKKYEFIEGDDKVPVVAITRPVKVNTLDFKRLRQAALRCTFLGSLNFYILGSNDGANFVCITGKEYPSKNGDESVEVWRRDLITSMSRSKQYKYIAIAVAGIMKGRISLAEMLVEGGFASNQLR